MLFTVVLLNMQALVRHCSNHVYGETYGLFPRGDNQYPYPHFHSYRNIFFASHLHYLRDP